MIGGARPEALIEVVRAAGAIVKRAATSPVIAEAKSDGTAVTATDRAVDDFLRGELARLVPGSGWLSEETADHPSRLRCERVWVVDPIDGTDQFVRGIDELAISVALVERGRIVAAAVSNPLRDEDGVWIDGLLPAFHGLEPRNVPATLDEVEAIVSRTEHDAGDLVRLGTPTGSARPVGSVAYKLLRVAAGADVLTYSVRPKAEWDVCGGIGLVLAAGRVYLRLDGHPLAFNQPVPRIPSGGVAGPEPLAGALCRRLIDALGV